jgi:hypothetical protein
VYRHHPHALYLLVYRHTHLPAPHHQISLYLPVPHRRRLPEFIHLAPIMTVSWYRPLRVLLQASFTRSLPLLPLPASSSANTRIFPCVYSSQGEVAKKRAVSALSSDVVAFKPSALRVNRRVAPPVISSPIYKNCVGCLLLGASIYFTCDFL